MKRGQVTSQIRAIMFVFAISVSLWLAFISFASAEVIDRFAVEILVQPSGELLVTETILYDFGEAQRHGIYRNLEETHPQPATSLTWLKKRYVAYELLSVQRDGQDEPYQAENGAGLSIRIGDSDQVISGEHTYEITYEIDGAIATYDTGTEIYWNVTGHEWTIPINNITVEVRAGENVSFLPEQACYLGTFGSTNQCDSTMLSDQRAIFSVSQLLPGEGVTIAQGLSLPQEPQVLERFNAVLLLIIGGVIWFIGLFIWLWRWRNKYDPDQSVIVQYEPYQDFKPMFTGVLFNNRLDTSDITAGIIYLAEQGFLSIRQTEEKVLFLFETNDYEITLNRSAEEVETDFQQKLLSLLGLTAVGRKVKLSDLKKDRDKLQQNVKVLAELQKATVADLIERGFLEQRIKRGLRIVFGVLVFILGFSLVMMSGAFLGTLAAGLLILVCGSVFLWLVLGFERRTSQGYEALYHLKGFKDFLSTTEKERYEFHNAPERNAEQFMAYLPYAIAFGVEKKWAKVFDDIQIEPPNWYSSSNTTAFNAAILTSDMSSFATAFASSTTPAGSSGSGGGGFSGGGGGGGGGGSW